MFELFPNNLDFIEPKKYINLSFHETLMSNSVQHNASRFLNSVETTNLSRLSSQSFLFSKNCGPIISVCYHHKFLFFKFLTRASLYLILSWMIIKCCSFLSTSWNAFGNRQIESKSNFSLITHFQKTTFEYNNNPFDSSREIWWICYITNKSQKVRYHEQRHSKWEHKLKSE